MSNDGVWSSSREAADLEERERGGLLGVPQRLRRGDLHRLGVGDRDAELAADPELDERDGEQDDDRDLRRAAEEVDVASRAACASTRRRARGAAGDQPGEDHVHPGEEQEPLEEDVDDVVGLGAPGLLVDLVADRMLHPRVGGEDEVGREPRPGPDEIDGREVHPRRQPVPAEDPEADERRLEHERADPLDRERRAEDVPDVRREHRPVHPELELHDEAGRDADREVDQEERPEEPRQPQPPLVARAVPPRLHHREHRRQPERQRDEDEVEERRQRELPARELERGGGELPTVSGPPEYSYSLCAWRPPGRAGSTREPTNLRGTSQSEARPASTRGTRHRPRPRPAAMGAGDGGREQGEDEHGAHAGPDQRRADLARRSHPGRSRCRRSRRSAAGPSRRRTRRGGLPRAEVPEPEERRRAADDEQEREEERRQDEPARREQAVEVEVHARW